MNAYFEERVRACAVDPVERVEVDAELRVAFADGRLATRKIDDYLCMFFAHLSRVGVSRAARPDPSAVPEDLGLYELLGFRRGETAVSVQDDYRFVVRF